MKHVFIINPRAGGRDQRTAMFEMMKALQRRHALTVEYRITRSAGHAGEIARNAAASGEEVRFYACGGDGTLNEIVNAIVDFPNAAVTCIPIGTGNDFVRNFGEETAALFSDAENLWDGDVHELDLIECNGRLCATIACAGVDARVAQDVHKYNSKPFVGGKTSYVAALGSNFLFKPISRRWTITVGSKVIPGAFSVVTACNGRYYGGGFYPCPSASLKDGVLNTIVIGGLSRATLATLISAYARGEYEKYKKYAYLFDAPEIRIDSEKRDITVSLDGEVEEFDHVVIRLSEKKMRFFAPKGSDPDATKK